MKNKILKSLLIVLFVPGFFLSAQKLEWVNTAGSSEILDIANDFSGNVYVTGWFTGIVDFNPSDTMVDNRESAGGKDVFILKYDWEGNYLWAYTIGGKGDDVGQGIAFSNENYSVNITGFFNDTAFIDTSTFDYIVSNGQKDAFLASFSDNGGFNWAKALGGKGDDEGTVLTSGAFGDIYLGGNFIDTMDINPDMTPTYIYSPNVSGFFLVKYDMSGYMTWYKHNMVHSGMSTINDISASEGGGPVYIAGSYTNELDLDAGTGDELTTDGNKNAFFARFSEFGNFSWAKQIGDNGDNEIAMNIMANDFTGLLYLAGTFEGNADFDPGAGTVQKSSNGLTDIFLAKFDTSANFHWVNQYGGAEADEPTGLGLDYYDNVFIGGKSTGDIAINIGNDEYKVINQGGEDAYVIKTNPSGHDLKIFPIQSPGNDNITTFSMFDNYLMQLGGSFDAKLDFDLTANTNEKTPAGANDFFVAAYQEFEMFLMTPEDGCPLSPEYVVLERKETPGLEITWQYQDTSMNDWQTIKENDIFRFINNDSLLVKAPPSFYNVKFRAIATDIFGVDSIREEDFGFMLLRPYEPVYIGNDTTVLPGEPVTISAPAGYFNYSWNTGDTTRTITTDSAGYYVATVINSYSCPVSDTLAVNLPFLVTFDSTTNQIMAVWNRSLNPGNESLNIYKSTGGAASLFNNIALTGTNRFYDTDVDPEAGPITYVFELKNNTSGETKIIARHVTIYLDALSYPGKGKTELRWNPYEGLSYDTFFIYRGPGVEEMELIGKVKYKHDKRPYMYVDSAYFADTMYYRVEIKAEISVLVNGKKANNGPFSRSLSNLEDNRQQATGPSPFDWLSPQVKIYPNPMNENCMVEFDNPESSMFTISLINLTGATVKTFKTNGNKIEISRSGLPSGFYIIDVNGSFREKTRLLIN